MKTQHTKGPWRVDEYEQADGGIRFTVETPKGSCLADVMVDQDPGFEVIARADAHLMASAPEMFEYLVQMDHMITAAAALLPENPIAKDLLRTQSVRLRPLIAKARGQECECEESPEYGKLTCDMHKAGG